MSASNIPLWGQAWELSVTYATASGSTTKTITANTWLPEPLRITFDILQSILPSPWWFADISIYNMTQPDIQDTIFNATWVTLKAGFQTGPNQYSTIWDGPIFQVLFEREDVVNTKTTLHCVANPAQLFNLVSLSVGQFSSQQDLVARMVGTIGLPPISPGQGTQTSSAMQLMQAKRYPRGNGVFGKVSEYLDQIAADNYLTTYQDGRQSYITDVSAPDLDNVVATYAPLPAYTGQDNFQIPAGITASIIGTPQQSPYGAEITVLLDPRLKVTTPPQVIQLDRTTLFNQITLNPNGVIPSPFTSDLKFLVAQVRHAGDSRGNTWQTDITGYTTTYAASIGSGLFSSQASGGIPSGN